jgi:hypothetical protein
MSTATTTPVSDKVKALAKDLTRDFPRSPRETIGGYVLAARCLDKCRATLNGTNGEYHFDCPLDNIFLGFAGIKGDDLKNFVATGASDEEVGEWIKQHAQQKEPIEVIRWNNEWRYKRISELNDKLQEFLEGYIPEVVPAGKVVHQFFDVYDIEEKRL